MSTITLQLASLHMHCYFLGKYCQNITVHTDRLYHSKGVRAFKAHCLSRAGGTLECVRRGGHSGKRGQPEQRLGGKMAWLCCRDSKYSRVCMHMCVCAHVCEWSRGHGLPPGGFLGYMLGKTMGSLARDCATLDTGFPHSPWKPPMTPFGTSSGRTRPPRCRMSLRWCRRRRSGLCGRSPLPTWPLCATR